jgi:hypothetical protein
MWKTEKYERLEESRRAEIAAAVEKGIAESRARHQALATKQEYLKTGRKFVSDNNVIISSMQIHDYTVTIGLMFGKSKDRVNIAYSICSPRDTFSARTGRGLIGNRLLNKDRCYCELTLSYDYGMALSSAEVRINVLKAMLADEHTPPRLIKKILV